MVETIERIKCLKVPVDNLPPENIPECIYTLLNSNEKQHIVLLSLWDLLRARKSGEYRSYVQSAALVIPISKSIISGIHFLTGKTVYRYMPFDFVVRVLNALEQREKSIYLLGGSRKSLQTAERNVRHTFPDLRIVGRCTGGFKRQEEATVIEAIKKASPSLLLVSKGVNGDERWIAHNIANFNPGIQVWCSDLFDIFAERRHRPSRFLFDRGLEWIGFCFRNPLLIFRFFPYLRYKLLLLWYRIFRR